MILELGCANFRRWAKGEVEGAHKFQHICKAVFRSWCERALEHRVERRGKLKVQRRHGGDCPTERVERMIACEHLVEHDGAAVLIATRINNPAGLLGSHIAHGSTHRYRLAHERPRLQ